MLWNDNHSYKGWAQPDEMYSFLIKKTYIKVVRYYIADIQKNIWNI